MRNPYAKYHIDPEVKKQGVVYVDEDLRITVTYAGTENSRYEKMLKLKLKPYETQIRNDSLPDSEFQKILSEVYAETVVLDWKVKNDDGEFVTGIYSETGEILEFNKDNVRMAFGLSQRLFEDIIKVATNFNLFRQGIKEDDLKN